MRGLPRLPLRSLLVLFWRLPVWGRVAAIIGLAGFALVGMRHGPVLSPVGTPYDRDLYRHWLDANHNCRNTRTEVLIRDALEPPQLSPDGCHVVGGRWRDAYTGDILTDPRHIDIDHRVPLAEAHRSGADRWTPERKAAYANDLSHPDTLVVTAAAINRAKGDQDPVDWMPPGWTARCAYLAGWTRVKIDWGLNMDLVESIYVRVHGALCR